MIVLQLQNTERKSFCNSISIFQMQPESIFPSPIYLGDKVEKCTCYLLWMREPLVWANMFKKLSRTLRNNFMSLLDPIYPGRLISLCLLSIDLNMIVLLSWIELIEFIANLKLTYFVGLWNLVALICVVKFQWRLFTWRFLDRVTWLKYSTYLRTSRCTILPQFVLTSYNPKSTKRLSRNMTGLSKWRRQRRKSHIIWLVFICGDNKSVI